ncbi:MAG: hypothetical protein LUQ35_07760 [Methanoregula sp.]|nr:hypothetical protein [Methanoregula sp.]
MVLDTIPAIFKSNPDQPAEEQCRYHADDGRIAILGTRHQEKIPDACAGSG